MKKCSTSLTIKKTQNKIVLRLHLIPGRMAIFKGNNNNKCWQDAAKQETYTLLLRMQISITTVKVVWRFLKKLKIQLP
jgi:hypothetical protein